MPFSFASQDSARSRRPPNVGWIRSKPSGTDAKITKNLFANEQILIGRDSRRWCPPQRHQVYPSSDSPNSPSQIIFNDPFVSNKHLRIYSIIFDQDQENEIPPLVYAEDLSRNGTYWNGNLMGAGNGGFLLSNGDVLKLSKNTELEFGCDDPMEDSLEPVHQKAAEKVFEKRYRITNRKIGSGGFGQVYMAINEFNHRQLACKIVPLDVIKEKYGACDAAMYKFCTADRPSPAAKVNPKTELLKLLSLKKRTILATELTEKLKTYDREVEILQSLNHPNIIRLEKVYKTDDYIYLFQELVTGGDLFSFLEYKNGKLLDVEAAVIIRQIVIAVDYLHDQGIVHRDLKPDNILMTSLANGARVVLTDFGGARRVDKNAGRMTTMVGTKEFIAPEVFGLNKTSANTPGYTKAVDLWSLGVVTIVLLTGGTIFIDPEKKEYCQKLASECNLDRLNIDPDWQWVGKRPKDFVRRLMVLDENERMTAKQALQHHWFTNDMNKNDFEDVYQRAIKNWKPRMTIGPVVEDFQLLTDDENKPTPKFLSKKSRRSVSPIDPPYKPYPKNFHSYLLPKRRSWRKLDEYIVNSQERDIDPDHIPDTDLEALFAEEDVVTSPELPTASNLNVSTPRKLKSAFQPLKRVFLEPLPLKPATDTKENDCGDIACDTPIASIEDVFKTPSKPRAPSKKGVLKENKSKPNKQWPFSPSAWSKSLRESSRSDSTISRTVSRELTPTNSKFHEPLPKPQKFVPLRPVTPRGASRNDAPDLPALWETRAEAEIAEVRTRTPTATMNKLTLKRVPSFLNVKRKRSGEDTGLDFEGGEENEDQGSMNAARDVKSRKRKRSGSRGSVFDIPDDDDELVEESESCEDGDDEIEEVEDEVVEGLLRSAREYSAEFESAAAYERKLNRERTIEKERKGHGDPVVECEVAEEGGSEDVNFDDWGDEGVKAFMKEKLREEKNALVVNWETERDAETWDEVELERLKKERDAVEEKTNQIHCDKVGTNPNKGTEVERSGEDVHDGATGGDEKPAVKLELFTF